MNIGDTILTIERYQLEDELIEFKFVSIITKIESNYVETEYRRPDHPIYSHAPYRRYGELQTSKNYYDPEGNINIEIM